jgi:hypothetical protein
VTSVGSPIFLVITAPRTHKSTFTHHTTNLSATIFRRISSTYCTTISTPGDHTTPWIFHSTKDTHSVLKLATSRRGMMIRHMRRGVGSDTRGSDVRSVLPRSPQKGPICYAPRNFSDLGGAGGNFLLFLLLQDGCDLLLRFRRRNHVIRWNLRICFVSSHDED